MLVFERLVFLLTKLITYLVARASNNGWEDSSGCIIAGKTSLAHSGSIVNDQSSSVFVAHGWALKC